MDKLDYIPGDMEKKDGTYDNREVYVYGFQIKL